MIKRLFIYILLVVLIVTIGTFVFKLFFGKTPIDETRTVYIKETQEGFQLYKNGRPFFIQGASGELYFEDLANIGGNTIRVYDTINLDQILADAKKYELEVIVDIILPRFQTDYNPYLIEENNIILKSNIDLFGKF